MASGDLEAFRGQVRTFIALSKRPPVDVARQLVGLIVKDAAANTPPAKGFSFSGAKQRGEAQIRGDLAHIFVGLKPDLYRAFEEIHGGRVTRRELRRKDGTVYLTDEDILVTDPRSWHRSQRRADGRVTTAGKRTRDIGRNRSHNRGVMPEASLRAYIKAVVGEVGQLAAGWVTPARGLGVTLPAWITRHASPGLFQQRAADALIEITIGNDVRFVDNVKDMPRRFRAAVDRRTGAIRRQLTDYYKKAARSAGLSAR